MSGTKDERETVKKAATRELASVASAGELQREGGIAKFAHKLSQAIIDDLNAARKAKGLPPLKKE